MCTSSLSIESRVHAFSITVDIETIDSAVHLPSPSPQRPRRLTRTILVCLLICHIHLPITQESIDRRSHRRNIRIRRHRHRPKLRVVHLRSLRLCRLAPQRAIVFDGIRDCWGSALQV